MALNPQKVLQGDASINQGMANFHNKAHFWGRLTLFMTILASLSAPLYMSFVVGAHPGWGPILAGLIGYAGFIGVMWVIEPITYYPILGIAGTYLAFLSGNISNLCLPCSAAAQEAIGAENGSNKGEIAGVFGIAVACLVNTIVIVIVILGGSYIIMMLPEAIKSAFNFILPAIFGAVLGQFAFKTPLYGLVGSLIGLAILVSPIISFIKIALCVAMTITFILYMEKLKDKKRAS
ncbi:MAG TPA: small-conductance mechanosensitive channel [Bacillus bacterium]|uniref:Small-conductance mechanosensitive channel n=1 Tax=Siminovitchia fordii TaxID=254759 RepID=A0ABQ4K6J7_9BACI|nr:hypothetical protein [Siminovitchia fordii]GIN20473.1 hypothetical protein J1TS3_16070 [Siminovitchia fordii]HBZ08397.1 small-conductance mechanosensitive channel [Bacillus sp. (in: firmicutes)]